jgi:hypothetical protein
MRPPLPARRLTVPAGYVLTNEEIENLLEAANARIAEGQPGITIDVEEDAPEWYAIRVPVGAALMREDAIAVLNLANRAVEAGHADVLLTVADRRIVKRWITLKDIGTGDRPVPAVGGRRRAREF